MRNGNLRKILENNFIFCLITVIVTALAIFIGLEINKVIFDTERCAKETLFPMIIGGLVILIMIAIRKGILIKNSFMFSILTLLIAGVLHWIISLIRVLILEEKYGVGQNTDIMFITIMVCVVMYRLRDKKLKNKQNEKERE